MGSSSSTNGPRGSGYCSWKCALTPIAKEARAAKQAVRIVIIFVSGRARNVMTVERLCKANRKSEEWRTKEKTFYYAGIARAKCSHEADGEKVCFFMHQNGRRAPRRSDPSVPACTPSNSHPDFDAGTAVRRVRAYVSLGGDAVEYLTGDSLQYGGNNKTMHSNS